MTDEYGFRLTKRRVLAALGSIGLASAGAGLGTSAYFSDQETFEGNRLVAGQLDLMVDWEEHYSDWSPDENDDVVRPGDLLTGEPDESDVDLDGDGTDDFRVVMTDGDPGLVPDGYVGLPTYSEPMIAVPAAGVDDVMENTAIEAWPDGDGNGVQDTIYTRDQLSSRYSGDELERQFRSQFAQVPDDLPRPLIEVADVKPGDFGEVTFSLHLFDNPGYVWMNGSLLANEENGFTEPEADDPDEDASESAPGELLDTLRAAVWQDDGNNYFTETEALSVPHAVYGDNTISVPADAALLAEGSLRDVLDALSAGYGIPLDFDPRSESPGRDCFPNSTTRYACFAWWLPVDHANEIQTDSVKFDLGFYTEQCRHNDGSGTPATIEIDDQTSDGTSVTVDSVYLPAGGFVVIHREAGGGGVGAPVATSAYLSRGEHRNVPIDVAVGDGETIYAMAHTDDGDRTPEFISSGGSADGPYVADGAPVVDGAEIRVPGGG